MKKVKNILLIGTYIFIIPVSTFVAFMMYAILGSGIYDPGVNSWSKETRDVVAFIFTAVLFIGASVVSSVPIWYIDYKSKKTRMIRQWIVIVLYAVALTLNWVRMVASY